MNAERPGIRNPKTRTLWLLIPSLLLITILIFDLLPVLRGNDEWRWPLRGPEPPARLLLSIITLGLYVCLGERWLRGFEREMISRRYERWFLLFVTLAAPLLLRPAGPASH